MLEVIGHRGARTLAVENSLLSLRAAMEGGADGVELDVQLSADGEPVVFHDDDLRRLCAEPGPLWRRSWRELRELSMRDGDLQPQPLAHFDDVLDWWTPAGGWLNVELKVAAGLPALHLAKLASAVAKRLAGLTAQQRLVVSSFSRPALSAFGQLAPQVRCAALVEPDPASDFWSLTRTPLSVAESIGQVHPHHSLLDAMPLQEIRQQQWPVWTWTVNRPAQWEQLVPHAKAGLLQGLISDQPQALRAFLERHAPELRAA